MCADGRASHPSAEGHEERRRVCSREAIALGPQRTAPVGEVLHAKGAAGPHAPAVRVIALYSSGLSCGWIFLHICTTAPLFSKRTSSINAFIDRSHARKFAADFPLRLDRAEYHVTL
jgi:hypothetical protein